MSVRESTGYWLQSEQGVGEWGGESYPYLTAHHPNQDPCTAVVVQIFYFHCSTNVSRSGWLKPVAFKHESWITHTIQSLVHAWTCVCVRMWSKEKLTGPRHVNLTTFVVQLSMMKSQAPCISLLTWVTEDGHYLHKASGIELPYRARMTADRHRPTIRPCVCIPIDK